MIKSLYFGGALLALAISGCSAAVDESEATEDVSTAQSALSSAQRMARIDAKRAANSWLGSAVGSHVQHTAGAHRVYQANRKIYVGDGVNQAFILLGLIDSRYQAKGAQTSALGYPVSDEVAAQNGGAAQYFTGGYVYWKSGAASAFEITGCSTWGYNSASFEVGPLGYLTSGTDSWNSQLRNTTEFGRVFYKDTGNGCLRDARVVFTSFRSGATYRGPRLFVSVEQASQTQSRLRISGGNGFTPNGSLYIYGNDPLSQVNLEFNRPVIDSNGNVSAFTTIAVPHSLIKTINGIASLLVIDSGGRFVSVPATGNGGSPWTGSF